MSAFSAFILLAAVSTGTASEHAKPPVPPVTEPVFQRAAAPPADGLTLYNAKGEVVARCEKKDDTFGNCKMEPGYNLDDLMNAWVHAYQDLQK